MLTVFFLHIVSVYLTSSYKVAIRNDQSTNGDESRKVCLFTKVLNLVNPMVLIEIVESF